MRVEVYNRETTCKHISCETLEVFYLVFIISKSRVV
jgi:hypothetical protein